MTRRELRQAEKRARRRRFRPGRPTSPTAMILAVTVVSALLGAGASQVYSDQQMRIAQRAIALAVAHEHANVLRSDRAGGARLDRLGIAFATVKRSEAVVLAEAAVAHAVSTRASSAPDVTAETLTPLDEAMDSLTALIEAAPAAPVPISPVPDDDAESEPNDLASPSDVRLDAASTAGAPAVPASVLDDLGADADPTQVAPGRAAATAADEGVDEGASEGASEGAGGTAGGTANGTANGTAGGTAGETADEAGDVADAAPVVTLDTVDLGLSTQMLVAAQLVTDLSAQVAAVADFNVAAAAAAAQAAAEAAAQAAADAAAAEAARVAEAAQAAAAVIAGKVDAVKNSENGAISADLLCGVGFDASVHLRCDAAQALDQLAVAYSAAFGCNPGIVSSYRSYSDQVAVRQSHGALAAVPGSSNHGRGLAIDLADLGSLGQFAAPGYLWMKEHAGEFGWHHPGIMEPGGGGPQEPWHWEFDTD